MGQMLQGILDRSRLFAREAKTKIEERRKARKGYELTADEQFIMAKLDEPKRTRLATLEAFEPQWTRQILYTAAIQHLRFLSTTRNYEPVRAMDWMPMPVVNIIQSKVQRIVDFFTRNRPKGFCVPTSEHEDDKAAADHAERVLQWLEQFNDEEEKRDEAATWMTITGNTFLKTYPDTGFNGNPPPQFQMGMEPSLMSANPVMTQRYQQGEDPSGMPMLDQQQQHVDIRTEVFGPMHMVVPLAAPRLHVSDAPWVMEVSLQPLHELRNLYPEKADFIGEKARVVTSDLYQHRILSLLTSGLHGVIRSLDPYTLDGYGIVYTLEEAPTRDFPNGLLLVAFDDIPLEINELPQKNNYSYEHCGYYRVPGRFWHRGVVEDLIDPQDQINKLEQFLRVNDDHNSQPTWLIPEQSGIPEGVNANKPGIQLRYTYPFKPEVVHGVPMPAQVIQRRAMYMEDGEEISGVRNVLMGNNPGGVTAGIALNRLREEAEGLFEPIAKRWDRWIERCAEAKLRLVADYWSTPRHLAVEGDDGTVMEVKDFKGSMIGQTRRFKIEAGSWRPQSTAGQQQLAFDMASAGFLPNILTDPEQHRKFLALMGLEGFDAEQSLDFRRAKLENEQLKRMVGWEQVQREPGDNDMIHIWVHQQERKKPEFARFPNVTKMRWLEHEAQHLEAIVQAGGMPGISEFATNPQGLEGTEQSADQPNEEQGGEEENEMA